MRHSVKAGISLVVAGMQIMIGCPMPPNSLSISLALAEEINKPKAVTESQMGASIDGFDTINNEAVAMKNILLKPSSPEVISGPTEIPGDRIELPEVTGTNPPLMDTDWWRGLLPGMIYGGKENSDNGPVTAGAEMPMPVSGVNLDSNADTIAQNIELPLLVTPNENTPPDIPLIEEYPVGGGNDIPLPADTTISFVDTTIDIIPDRSVVGLIDNNRGWVLPADPKDVDDYYLQNYANMTPEELEQFKAFCGWAGASDGTVLFSGEKQADRWEVTDFITGNSILAFGQYGDKFVRDGIRVMYRSSHFREGQPLRDIVYDCFDLNNTFNKISVKAGVAGWYADIDRSNPEALITIYLAGPDDKGHKRVKTRIVFSLKGMQEGYADVTDFDPNTGIEKQDDEGNTYQVHFNIPDLLDRFSKARFEYEKPGTTVGGASGSGSSSSSSSSGGAYGGTLGASSSSSSSDSQPDKPSTPGTEDEQERSIGNDPEPIPVVVTGTEIKMEQSSQPAEVDYAAQYYDRRTVDTGDSVVEASSGNSDDNDFEPNGKKKKKARR